MIYFITENSPKEKKSIGAQNKMIDITKCLKLWFVKHQIFMKSPHFTLL
jgi:hypothetical protein